MSQKLKVEWSEELDEYLSAWLGLPSPKAERAAAQFADEEQLLKEIE